MSSRRGSAPAVQPPPTQMPQELSDGGVVGAAVEADALFAEGASPSTSLF